MVSTPQSGGLGHRVARSSAWSVGGQVSTLVVSLGTTPILVRKLGPAGYGLLGLVNAILAYVAVTDFGMGATSTRFAAAAHARNDAPGEAQAIWSAAAVAGLTGLTAALLIAVFSPSIASGILHAPPSLRHEEATILALAAGALFARSLAGVMNSAAQARLRWDLLTLATSGGMVAQQLTIALVVGLGAGITEAVAVLTFFAGAVLVAQTYVGLRLLPEARVPQPRLAVMSPMLRMGIGLLGANLIALVLANAERFLLIHYHPARDLGFYTVAANLASVIAVFSIALCQPLLPTFARLGDAPDRDQLASIYARTTRYILFASLIGGAALITIGRSFLGVWAGARYAHGAAPALYILAPGLVANAIAFVPYNLLLGTGRARSILICHLVEFAPYLGYSVLLVARFGVIGAAAAWTLRAVLAAVLFTVVTSRQVGLPRNPFGHRSGALVIPLLLTSLPVGLRLSYENAYWPIWLGALTLIGCSIYGWLTLFEPSDRDSLLSLLGRKASKPRIGGG